jgi:hypothetical protein
VDFDIMLTVLEHERPVFSVGLTRMGSNW